VRMRAWAYAATAAALLALAAAAARRNDQDFEFDDDAVSPRSARPPAYITYLARLRRATGTMRQARAEPDDNNPNVDFTYTGILVALSSFKALDGFYNRKYTLDSALTSRESILTIC
jgi:hypothetical protein